MTRLIGTPEPGYYKRRLTKGGPWVAVRFFRDGEGELRAEVDGRTERNDGTPFDPDELWPISWPSDEKEHRFFAMMREWAQRYAPQHPAARPHEPIRLDTMAPRRRP
jgi:hypothetical protein